MVTRLDVQMPLCTELPTSRNKTRPDGFISVRAFQKNIFYYFKFVKQIINNKI